MRGYLRYEMFTNTLRIINANLILGGYTKEVGKLIDYTGDAMRKLFGLFAVGLLFCPIFKTAWCDDGDVGVGSSAPVVVATPGVSTDEFTPVVNGKMPPAAVVKNNADVQPAAANLANVGVMGNKNQNDPNNQLANNKWLQEGVQITKDGNFTGKIPAAQFPGVVANFMNRLIKAYNDGDQSAGQALDAMMNPQSPYKLWGPAGLQLAQGMINGAMPGKYAPLPQNFNPLAAGRQLAGLQNNAAPNLTQLGQTVGQLQNLASQGNQNAANMLAQMANSRNQIVAQVVAPFRAGV